MRRPGGSLSRRAVRVVAALLTLAPRVAWAGDGDLPTIGNEAAISAGAVVAAGRGPGMAWYNPAALGANRRAKIETSSQAFVLRLHRVDGGEVTGLPDGERKSDIRSREIVIIPGATVWAFRVADHVSLALSLFVPTFDEIDMDTHRRGTSRRVSYGQQIRVQHNQRRYEAGPSVGWEITPRLRIGASAFVVYDRIARSSRAWAWGLDLGDNNERFVQTDVSESVRSWGTELVGGVQWSPTDHLDLGLSVRSGQLWLAQNSRSTAVATNGGTTSGGGSTGDIEFIALDSGVVRPHDPVELDAGVAYRFTQGWVAIDGVAAPARRGGDDEGRRARWGLRIGTRVQVTPDLVLGGGVYANRSTTVVADDFLDFDLDTYGATAGGTLRRAVRLGRGERARTIVFTPTLAVRYALAIGHAGRMRFDLTNLDSAAGDVLVTTGAPVAARVHDMALHLGTGVDF